MSAIILTCKGQKAWAQDRGDKPQEFKIDSASFNGSRGGMGPAMGPIDPAQRQKGDTTNTMGGDVFSFFLPYGSFIGDVIEDMRERAPLEGSIQWIDEDANNKVLFAVKFDQQRPAYVTQVQMNLSPAAGLDQTMVGVTIQCVNPEYTLDFGESADKVVHLLYTEV